MNNAASDFSIPPQYNAQKLLHNNTLKGYDAASDYNPQTSHFLGLCMKVVYEKELVIKVCTLLLLCSNVQLLQAWCKTSDLCTGDGRPLQFCHARCTSLCVCIHASLLRMCTKRVSLQSTCLQKVYVEVQTSIARGLHAFGAPPQDVVESWWGLRFHSYWQTGSDSFVIESETGQRTFVPRTRAAVFSSPDAVVLTFRGSEPTNLINLRSAGT